MEAKNAARALQLSTPEGTPSRQALMLLVLIVLGLLLVLRTGWVWYSDARQELETSIDLLGARYDKLSRVIAGGEEFEQTRETLGRFRSDLVARRFITGSTQSLAEAKLQTIVKDMAQRHRIDIRSTKLLPPVKKDGLTMLEISFNARAEIGAIRDFILAVQGSEQFIFLDYLEIKQISIREKRFFYFNAQLLALTDL